MYDNSGEVPILIDEGSRKCKEEEFQMPDPDLEGATNALIRAAKRARRLAAQTRTELVVIRDGKLVREIPKLEELDEDAEREQDL